ncbi:MAG: DKNYY domain-containing protein [Candidatus Moraniibacteriota bacterium]|jgi:DKNYY family protein
MRKVRYLFWVLFVLFLAIFLLITLFFINLKYLPHKAINDLYSTRDFIGKIFDRCYSVQAAAKGPQFKILKDRICVGNVNSSGSKFTMKTFEGLDPKTFREIGSYGYFADKDTVYYNNILINANPLTFRALKGYYAKDASKIFYKGLEVDADYASFEMVSFCCGYARDKDKVFYYQKIVENVDPNSFEKIGHGYYKDNTNIIYGNSIMTDVDYDTFELIEESVYGANDKNHMYDTGLLVTEKNYK